MAHFKEQSEPFVFDFKNLLKVLSGKEAEAQSEVDAFMENCAKRWQTREGTYQLKRRRLKPDVRDSPEDLSADVERGAFCFSLSHLVCKFPWQDSFA